jgi:hypothetical protein
MKTTSATVVLLILVLCTPSFSQSTYATVSGTVEDPTKALIPGVTMKALNTATGVSTTVLTNESGTYSFASLLPGLYKISAELAGFQTHTYSDVRLGSGDQIRLNFTLKVGGVNTAVDVSVQVDTLLATSSSSIGEVLNQQRVAELPTVTNNVLDLYRLIPGIRLTDDAGNNGVVSGLGGLGTVNITRDGVDNVGAARFGVSLQGATYMSPDIDLFLYSHGQSTTLVLLWQPPHHRFHTSNNLRPPAKPIPDHPHWPDCSTRIAIGQQVVSVQPAPRLLGGHPSAEWPQCGS